MTTGDTCRLHHLPYGATEAPTDRSGPLRLRALVLRGGAAFCAGDRDGCERRGCRDLLDADDGAGLLLAVLVPGFGDELAGDQDAVATLVGLGGVLSRDAPDFAVEAGGLSVLPLLAVLDSAVDQDAEARDGLPGRGVAQLDVVDEVAGKGEGRVHGGSPS
ncbi:hypothetical protein GCM10009795_096530 [Nocardioides hankookensis]